MFEPQCVVDSGKVFYQNNSVYRAIKNPVDSEFYKDLIKSNKLNEIMKSGLLVRTELTDLKVPGYNLVLKHEKIQYFLHPAEMTDLMFWQCAKSFIALCKELNKYELTIKDSHPWNMTFHLGKPIFFDFTSITTTKMYTNDWFEEFYTYFVVPLKLASTRWQPLAKEYRRQHTQGFGILLSNSKLCKRVMLRSYTKLYKYISNTYDFLSEIDQWLERNKPKTTHGYWDDYNQAHESDYINPKTVKQKFVYDILKQSRPETLCDLATNKGFYAHMAEHLGANVIGFDYEAYSVNKAYELGGAKNLTFAHMNFIYPTPEFGLGCIAPNSFTRYRSDIALSLGLIHHVCLVQKLPVKLFCDICAKYSKKGVILEFVYPDDKHVKSWNIITPEDYNELDISNYFSLYFDKKTASEILDNDGIRRQLFYFYNENDL